jgi:hypothetical protein
LQNNVVAFVVEQFLILMNLNRPSLRGRKWEIRGNEESGERDKGGAETLSCFEGFQAVFTRPFGTSMFDPLLHFI